MAAEQREISVSEFFAKNRHLLGFDNPRKAMLTAVKEYTTRGLVFDANNEALQQQANKYMAHVICKLDSSMSKKGK